MNKKHQVMKFTKKMFKKLNVPQSLHHVVVDLVAQLAVSLVIFVILDEPYHLLRHRQRLTGSYTAQVFKVSFDLPRSLLRATFTLQILPDESYKPDKVSPVPVDDLVHGHQRHFAFPTATDPQLARETELLPPDGVPRLRPVHVRSVPRQRGGQVHVEPGERSGQEDHEGGEGGVLEVGRLHLHHPELAPPPHGRIGTGRRFEPDRLPHVVVHRLEAAVALLDVRVKLFA